MKRINYEEQKCRFFTRHTERYPQMLYRYKHAEEFYAENAFAASTGGDGATHAFYEYLRTYIKEFSPVCMHKEKGYNIKIDANGAFTVFGIDGKKAKLDKSENIVFQYLCYLCLVKFWHGYEMMRDLHYLPPPLVIKDFRREIEDRNRYNKLINEARNLTGEIILLKSKGELWA